MVFLEIVEPGLPLNRPLQTIRGHFSPPLPTPGADARVGASAGARVGGSTVPLIGIGGVNK